MEVNGKNQQDVLTGQVPVSPACRLHRSVAHDAEGSADKTFCNRCGKDDAGVSRARPNGGWA